VATLKANPKITLGTMESTRCYFWTLDVDRDGSPQITDADGKPMTKNPLKDERVRRAMSMAIDRAALVSKVMQGQAGGGSAVQSSGDAWDERENEAGGVRSGGGEKKTCSPRLGMRTGSVVVVNSSNDRYPNDAQVNQAVAQMWEPAGAEDLGERGAQGDLLPSGCQAGIQRPPWLEFHRYRGASFAAAVFVGDLQASEGDGGRKLRALLRSEVRRDHRQSGDDTGRRQAECVLAEAYEYAIGQQVVVIPMLFPITTWAMRKGIVYNGFPQETTVASLVHAAH